MFRGFIYRVLIIITITVYSYEPWAMTCKTVVEAPKNKFEEGIIKKIHQIKSNQSEHFFPLIELAAETVRAQEVPSLINKVFKTIRQSVRPVYASFLPKDKVDNITYTKIPEGLDRYQNLSNRASELSKNELEDKLIISHEFLWIDLKNKFEKDNSITMFEYIPTFQGEYSMKHYENLTLTTAIIFDLLRNNKSLLNKLTSQIDSSEVEFARKSSNVLRYDGTSNLKESPSFNALVEGVLSLHQYLTVLTGSKVKGVEPEFIVESLLESSAEGRKSITMLTQMLPMAIVGPLSIKGFYFDQPLKLSESGKIIPAKYLIDFFKKTKNKIIPYVNQTKAEGHVTCTGCPMVSGKKNGPGGIDILANLYLDVYLQVINRN